MGVLNVISRRLAGLKKATGPVCVLKTLVQDFSVSNCPQVLIGEPDAIWASTKLNVSYHSVDSIQM